MIFTLEELRIFSSISHIYMAIIEDTGKFIKTSRNWPKALGYPRENLLKGSFLDLVHHQDLRQMFSCLMKASHGEEQELVSRVKRADMSFAWIHWSVCKGSDGLIFLWGKEVGDFVDKAKYAPIITEFDRKALLSRLTDTEKKIFEFLELNKNRAVPKKLLVDHVYAGTKVQPQTLNVHMFNLRKKLRGTPFNVAAAGKGQWLLKEREQ